MVYAVYLCNLVPGTSWCIFSWNAGGEAASTSAELRMHEVLIMKERPNQTKTNRQPLARQPYATAARAAVATAATFVFYNRVKNWHYARQKCGQVCRVLVFFFFFAYAAEG